MADAVAAGIARYGEDNAGGTEEALFLKVFAGEVLSSFQRHSVTDGTVRTRTISSGKSASFPLVGAMNSSYHVPGENLMTETTTQYLSDPRLSEKIIVIDGILQSSVLIADIDDAMSHYDVRSPFSREMGWALSKRFDLNVLWAVVSGSEDSAQLGSSDGSDWETGGSRILDSSWSAIANIKTNFEAMAKTFDVNDVPSEGRFVAVTPTDFYTMASDDDFVNADYANQGPGTGGSTALGGATDTLMYAGWTIKKTNRMTDLAAHTHGTNSPLGTDYSADLTNIKMAFWQRDNSVGVVKLKELGMQSEYQLPYLATLLVGGFATGTGVLHQSACGCIKSS